MYLQHFGQRQMAKVIGEHTHSPGKQEELRQRKKATTSIPPFSIV